MRVLFLEIDTESAWAVASLGPALLAAYLRKFGHEATFVRVPLEWTAEDLADRVAALAPDLLGVSLTTRQWLRARHLIGVVRDRVDVPVVAGGLHPTFSAEPVLATPGFDFVCRGEGEPALLDLVTAVAAGQGSAEVRIPNIWGKGGPEPSLRKPFEPLDDLPFMARDHLDERYGVIHMTTQRGCPFKCTYCAARMYNELYSESGYYGRRRSIGNVLAELAAIRDQGSLNYVIFLDDTFTINHPWVNQFCREYGETVGVPFSLHARVETVSERLLARLAAAGCRHITYGVESGSDRIRREVMRRPVDNERFVDVFRWTREAGILVTANYMLGLPTETPADMEATLGLHHRLEPDDFGFFVFYPYPGTHLYRYCDEHGLLPPNHLELPANHRSSVLQLPTLSSEDIHRCYERWTQVRAAAALRRSGELSGMAERSVVQGIEHCAAAG
jgi:radical SAM superfamily enzyme YgiQ (UPF0313 family)